jgi:hypothetical protein
MMRRRTLWIAAAVVLVALAGWGLTRALEYVVTPRVTTVAGTSEPAPSADVPHITATLYYASADATGLVPVRRDVPLAEGAVAQGREILAAQLQPAPEPYVSVVPTGTTLRAFYITSRGDAFVDLSREASVNHPGGSFTELLTVYAIVNAVTANLPAVQRVQLLVDGKEVDTLAGHVDLRRPLQRDPSLVREDESGAASTASAPPQ